jgi:FtsH-binding integral membrane protein
MALIGIIIASLVNIFMKSDTMDWIISYAGVAIFTGLTAYDVQKLKAIGMQDVDGNTKAKLSLIGALTLYLDFVNLFLMLLRIFGDRK